MQDQIKVVTEQAYEVSVIERTQVCNETTGNVTKNAVEFLKNREMVVATSGAAAKAKMERKLTSPLDGEQADALLDRIEVKVELRDFR